VERDIYQRQWKYVPGFLQTFVQQVPSLPPILPPSLPIASPPFFPPSSPVAFFPSFSPFPSSQSPASLSAILLTIPSPPYFPPSLPPSPLLQEDAFIQLIEGLYPGNSDIDKSSREALR
jgi:hypothetical protein